MRRGPALLASVLAHGAALALVVRGLASREARPAAAPEDAAPPAERAVVEPSTFDVVLLPEDRGAPAVGAPGAPRASGAGRSAIATSPRGAPAEALGPGPGAGGEHTGSAGGSGALSMRGRRHDLSLPTAAIERVLRDTRPPPPAVVPSGRLAPAGGGAHAIDDEVVSVRVRPDGTVVMTDKPDFTAKLALPLLSFEEMRRFLGALLTEWYRDPYAMVRAAERDDELSPRAEMACDLRGDPICDSPAAASGGGGGLPLFHGKADLTAYLMRKTGVGDAYRSRKLKLLDDTRDERVEIGAAHRTEQRARAAELVHRNLEALWRTTPDPAARRAALFTLWDECDEGEGEAGRAGDAARAMVIGWIRTRLPEGSPGAFTADEIARLDAGRTSRRRFAPYR